MLPPVSEPSETVASYAATEAAEPPEEPPGTLFKLCGFLTILKAEFSLLEPIANSSRFAFPTIGTKFSLSFFVTVASNGDTKFSRIFELAVVFEPVMFILSLSARGMPAIRGSSSFFAIFSSTFFAVSIAYSFVKELYAPILSSRFSICLNVSSTSSRALISLFNSAFLCSTAVFFNNSIDSAPLFCIIIIVCQTNSKANRVKTWRRIFY